MIPIRDVNPSRTTPWINYLLIALNIAVFLFELALGDSLAAFIDSFGVVPSRVVAGLEDHDPSALVTVATSMFLHGGFMHLLGNMVFLHVFGDNVEDRFGHAAYLAFYVISGSGAAALQIAVSPASAVPMIGASGAVAGVLGAYVLMYPRARVVALIPVFVFLQFMELPAFMFLGLWFLMQIASGLLSLQIGGDAGGVAWWAHIGGFLAGAAMMPILRGRR